MRSWLLVLVAACSAPPSSSAPTHPVTPRASAPVPDRVPQRSAQQTHEPPSVELGPRAKIKLVILGEFPEELAAQITTGLSDELQVEVERMPTRPLPRSAYYAPRRRYRADTLVDEELEPLLEGEPLTTKVIGFTSVDISTTARGHRDWGVFGLGQLGGRASVISLFRLRRGMRDDALLLHRVVSTAIHEVGHTLGLAHCTEPRCVMNDAHGTVVTVDNSTGHLGPECRAEVERRAPRPR